MDEVVSKISTLQYCYVRGNGHVPMVVDDHEMSRFIHAVKTSKSPRFYSPDELTPSMAGKMVRIVGGSLDGYEGRLQKMQGSRVKRLFVEIPGLFAVAVEVQSEYIQVLPPSGWAAVILKRWLKSMKRFRFSKLISTTFLMEGTLLALM